MAALARKASIPTASAAVSAPAAPPSPVLASPAAPTVAAAAQTPFLHSAPDHGSLLGAPASTVAACCPPAPPALTHGPQVAVQLAGAAAVVVEVW